MCRRRSGIDLAPGWPFDGQAVIEIYLHNGNGAPSTSAGPMAVMFSGGNRVHLTVPGPATFERDGGAWEYFIRQLGWYFDRDSPAETKWAYAWYHCGTMANNYAATIWVRKSAA